MPRLNLRDQDSDYEPEPMDDEGGGGGEEPQPQLRHQYHDGGGHSKTLLIVLLIIVLAGGGLVALNQLHVIHLWGKKVPRVIESASEPPLVPDTSALAKAKEPPPSTSATPMPPDLSGKKGQAKKGVTAPAEKKPAPVQTAAAPSKPPAASNPAPAPTGGGFAVQVSAWPSREAADKAASAVNAKGFSAYVMQADVKGKTWYRVRVGSYTSADDAGKAAADLQDKGYAGALVVKAQ